MARTAAELLEALTEVAPLVAFTVSRELDEDTRWDGDGPDPVEDGYDPYNIDVKAKAIINGHEVEGTASLGSSYYKPDEPIDDAHGYLPQMLKEAATELLALIPKGKKEYPQALPVSVGLERAIALLKGEMADRYNEQMAERKSKTPA